MAKRNGARWTVAEAERELAGWRASGKSLAAYARERGLKVQRLIWWKRRLSVEQEEAAAPTRFAAAVIRPSRAVATLRCGTDAVLEIEEPAGVPAEWVAALLLAVSRR